MEDSKLKKIRHSLAHVMAAAVWQMFPETKFGIGPTIENGFYYDFDLPRTLIPEDLPLIEERMKKIIKEDVKFIKKSINIDKAIKFFTKANQKYKIELLKDLRKKGEKQVTLYKSGDFVDLCRGPHLKSTKELDPDAFKLVSIAGAYWKGSETNPMLQRIYGVAFENKKDLVKHLRYLKEVEKRDHRKLGKEMDIFQISDEIGAGLPIFQPNGALIRDEIERFWKEEHRKRGYKYIYTPHIGKLSLWKKSGHWQHYREMMYSPIEIDGTKYLLKPMNCPFHVQVYKSDVRSYRDLPFKTAEIGTVYRWEKPGVLHGLLRVRMISQDDAHIFCRINQLEKEIEDVLELAFYMLKSFGFKEFEIELAVRDEAGKKNYIGKENYWQRAEAALVSVLDKKKLKYVRAEGEAKFYGPSIDIKLKDALGRFWQGPTIQVDFNFPEKFNLNYIDEQGKKIRPVMVHRTVLGAMERFIGNLIEHWAGHFPLWLAPEQVRILPVSDKFKGYADKLGKRCQEMGIRFRVDEAAETLGKRIREAEIKKIPYILVVGEKEERSETVAVRHSKRGDLGKMRMIDFLKKIKKEIETKSY